MNLDFFKLTFSEHIMLFVLIIIVFQVFILLFINNMMHVIIVFLLIYVETAVYLLICQIEYLAYMFLIIYAGAIIILFIFVLMLINTKSYKKNILFIEFLDLFLYVSFVLFILTSILFNSSSLLLNDTLNVIFLEYIINVFNYVNSFNSISFNDLYLIGSALYNNLYLHTLFAGLILLLSLVYIIWYLKK